MVISLGVCDREVVRDASTSAVLARQRSSSVMQAAGRLPLPTRGPPDPPSISGRPENRSVVRSRRLRCAAQSGGRPQSWPEDAPRQIDVRQTRSYNEAEDRLEWADTEPPEEDETGSLANLVPGGRVSDRSAPGGAFREEQERKLQAPLQIQIDLELVRLEHVYYCIILPGA